MKWPYIRRPRTGFCAASHFFPWSVAGAAALNGYVYKIYVYKTVWWSRLYDVAKRLSSPLTVTRARTLADCYNAMLFRRCAATWHMRETIVHTWRVSIVSIALPHALELFLWSTALATAWLTGWCNSGKQPCRSLRTAMGSHSYISYTDSLVQRAVSHPHFLTWCGGHADMRQPHNPASPFLRGCDPPFRLTSIWYDVVGMKQWQPSTPIQCCSRTSNVSAFHCDPPCLLHPCATRAVVDMMI